MFTKSSGTAGNGWYMTCGCQDATVAPAVKAFAAAYQAKFNTPPSTYSPEAYDATNLLIQAIKAARQRQPDPGQRRGRVNDSRLQGHHDEIKFQSDGDRRPSGQIVNLYQQKAGVIKVMGDIKASRSELVASTRWGGPVRPARPLSAAPRRTPGRLRTIERHSCHGSTGPHLTDGPHGDAACQQLPQNLSLGLEQGSMYALVALGYTLVYGVLQLINFAHSEVFMSGAFGSYLVVNGIIGNRHLTGLVVPLTLLVGLLIGARGRRVRRLDAGEGRLQDRCANAGHRSWRS